VKRYFGPSNGTWTVALTGIGVISKALVYSMLHEVFTSHSRGVTAWLIAFAILQLYDNSSNTGPEPLSKLTRDQFFL